MKKLILAILFCAIATLSFGTVSCRIDFSIKGLENKNLAFGYEFGNRQIFIDTIKLDSQGKGFYQSSKRLPGGIYLIVFPGNKYIEMLINEEQFFTVNTDTNGLLNNMYIEGSEESQLFIQYLINQNTIVDSIRTKAVQNFKTKISNELPQSFLYKYIKLSEVSDFPINEGTEKTKPDRDYFIQRYNYIKAHFFDKIPFEDTRILRTRLIYDKLDYFLNTFTSQNFDSLISSIKQIVNLAKVNNDSYHFVLGFIFDNYKIPKNSLQERVFVYIADNYYLGGKAPWADKKFLKLLENRINELKPSVENNIAPDLELKSIDGKKIILSQIKSTYTILLFWSPDCNNCINQVVKINEVYKKFKNSGLVVFAVYAHADKEIWSSFLKKNSLNWIHAYDPTLSSNFSKLYNITTLPKIYLLAADKKILLKDTDPEKIETYLKDK